MKNNVYANRNTYATKRQICLANFLATLLLLMAFSQAQAQCPSNAEYRLYGSASLQSSGEIQLTANLANQAGQAWSKRVIDLRQPFSQTFDINLGTSNAGGDGFAFVLRGTTIQTVGTSGQGLGYQGITPSLAFEFDTYDNGGADMANDHFALHRQGNPFLTGRIGNAVDLGNIEDGAWRTAIINWVPSTQTITVTVNGVVIYTVVRDIITLDFGGNPNVILGFTASTGTAFNSQRVCIKELTYTPYGCPFNDEYVLTGNATIQNGGMLITPNLAGQSGQAWSKKTIDLTKDFNQAFDMNLGTNDAGGDGLAFLLRGNTTMVSGNTGGGMGYQLITPSLAFEFDTYSNSDYADMVNDHFALHRNGNPQSFGRIGSNVDLGNLEDGVTRRVIIDWEASTKTITVTIDGVIKYTTVRDIVALDFAGNPYVTIGFTASTGDFFNIQNVCIGSLTYTPCNVGIVAPSISASTVSTVCPIKTANLNSLVTSTIPDGTTLAWFTNTARTGTALSTPTAAGAGTYYGFYYDPAGNCYSPASAAVTVSTQGSFCADLSLTAIPNLSTKNKGEIITYTCTLSNAGPDAAPNTKVQVRIPNNTTLLTAVPSQGTFVDANYVWEAGSVANGANLTITVTVKVD
jgi:uncharacterized repeat protein (TIGR01451 family)